MQVFVTVEPENNKTTDFDVHQNILNTSLSLFQSTRSPEQALHPCQLYFTKQIQNLCLATEEQSGTKKILVHAD